jgi:hypothetical protein
MPSRLKSPQTGSGYDKTRDSPGNPARHLKRRLPRSTRKRGREHCQAPVNILNGPARFRGKPDFHRAAVREKRGTSVRPQFDAIHRAHGLIHQGLPNLGHLAHLFPKIFESLLIGGTRSSAVQCLLKPLCGS